MKNIVIAFIVLSLISLALPVKAATYKFTPSINNFTSQCRVALNLYADATGQSSNAADVTIKFNPNEVEILDSNSASNGIQIKTGVAYESYILNQVDSSAGTIKIAAFSFSNFLTSNQLFATIELRSKTGITSSNLTIDFTSNGATLDSNIADSSTSLDLLNSVTNATVNFSAGSCVQDTTPPNASLTTPTPYTQNYPTSGNIVLTIVDSQSGVDLNTVKITINGITYTSTSPSVIVSGDPQSYTFTIQPGSPLPSNQESTVIVTATDLAGNNSVRSFVFNIPPNIIVTDPGKPQVCPVCNNNQNPNSIINKTILDNTIFKGTPIQDLVEQLTFNNLNTTVSTSLGLISILFLLPLLNAPGLILTIISYILGKRHKKPWGLVIDKSNGKPIAFAACRLYKSGTLFVEDQTVSDLEGRYSFPVSTGKYRLEVSQSGYQRLVKEIVILDTDQIYAYDIELVPNKLTDSKDSVSLWLKFLNAIREFFRIIFKPLFVIGFLLSIVSVILAPAILNWIILAIYIVIILLYEYEKFKQSSKGSSVVDTQSNLRIPYAMVKLYNTKTWKVTDTLVTNNDGKFEFFGEPGEYALLVIARGYKFPSQKQLTDPNFRLAQYNSMLVTNLKRGSNNLTIYVDTSIDGLKDLDNLQDNSKAKLNMSLNKSNLQSPFN